MWELFSENMRRPLLTKAIPHVASQYQLHASSVFALKAQLNSLGLGGFEMADIEKQTTEQREAAQPSPDELKQVLTVDTVHQDEALKVLGRYSGDLTWTPKDEKKLVTKIDRKLLPLLVITYGLQYYDKAMLSQAVTFTYPSTSSEHSLTWTGTLWPAR